jgi:ABC-type Mn2+/Zn2+ transport system permease subunit
MEPIAEMVAKKVVLAVVEEAVAEVRGTTTRKWAVVFLAVVLGTVVAGVIVKRRRARLSGEREPQSVT